MPGRSTVSVGTQDSVPTRQTVTNMQQNTRQTGNINKPKLNQTVTYLPAGESEWRVARVISRAGKKDGKYSDWLNIQFEDNSMMSIDWKNGVEDWYLYQQNEMHTSDSDLITNDDYEAQEDDTEEVRGLTKWF